MTTRKVYYYYGEELYHHGIQGQKWGVRRYQNEDGTLTDAGKKRYGAAVNPNLNDKSYTNIAKIRLGKARMNLDQARESGADKSTIKGLKKDLRAAKRVQRTAKIIDKGNKLVEEGKTSSGEATKGLLASYVGVPAAMSLAKTLGDMGIQKLCDKGKLTETGHKYAVRLRDAGILASGIGMIAYEYKKFNNYHAIKKSNRAQWDTRFSKSNIGGKEYKQVKEENKKK